MDRAREILGVADAATPQDIKSAYKKKALLLHPDRNKSPDAANQFRELHDAYALLSAAPKAALFDVDLADLFREYMPEYQALVRLLMAHKPTPVHLIEPSIDDVLAHKIFIYQNKYSVPLWHQTLVFEDFTIQCAPKREENRWVDADNNLHVAVRRNLEAVFREGRVVVDVGGREAVVPACELKLVPQQVCVVGGCGLPIANEADLLDVSALGAVVVHLSFI